MNMFRDLKVQEIVQQIDINSQLLLIKLSSAEHKNPLHMKGGGGLVGWGVLE